MSAELLAAARDAALEFNPTLTDDQLDRVISALVYAFEKYPPPPETTEEEAFHGLLERFDRHLGGAA